MIRINTKDLEPLGFKGLGLMASSWHHHYYLELPKKRKIYIVDSLDQSISHFKLTPKEYQQYKQDRVSLIPLGCCSAGGSDRILKENPTLDFEGDFERLGRKRDVIKYIKDIVDNA